MTDRRIRCESTIGLPGQHVDRHQRIPSIRATSPSTLAWSGALWNFESNTHQMKYARLTAAGDVGGDVEPDHERNWGTLSRFAPWSTDVHPTQGFTAGLEATAMTAQDHPRRSSGPRSGSRRPGSTRPQEAPRPRRPSSSSTGSTSIRLYPATFVKISADQNEQDFEALKAEAASGRITVESGL